MPEKKFGGHRARLREKEHLSRYRAQSYVLYAHVLMCAR